MDQEFILKAYQNINSRINYLSQEILKLPDGRLTIMSNGKNTRWRYTNGRKKKYLSKRNDRRIASELTQKEYYTLQLISLERQRELLKTCIEKQKRDDLKLHETFYDNPEINKLLSAAGNFSDPSPDINAWLTEEYTSNPLHPESKKHKTKSGIYVRSKSEQLWANMLFDNHIPFRYEAELALENSKYYPDFTVLHPVSFTLFYIEHFGMIDKNDYLIHNLSKLNNYISYGIVPSVNLICSYETTDHPLDPGYVQEQINYYFKQDI